MKTLLLTLSLMLLASCDQPQRNRINNTMNPSSMNPGTAGEWGNPFGNNQTAGTNNGQVTSGGTSGTGTGSGSTRPPGFENCDISHKYYASTINYMGICQSTLDETSVAVSSSVTDTVRTCLIPTYKDAAGSTTYLGQPQCYAPNSSQVMMGKLYKTRSGFSNLAINAVMVMKEGSLGAYFTCMDAYVNFRDSRCANGAKTPVYQQNYPPYQIINCDAMARQAMSVTCNAFKSNHPYIDIPLK